MTAAANIIAHPFNPLVIAILWGAQPLNAM
jgi:hypothetical protein